VCQWTQSWRMVTSGVPQGSVLGPVQFLICIKDLEENFVNSVFKFADDTKVLGKADSSEDRDHLQVDFGQLMDWSNTWQLPINTSKCKVMHIGRHNEQHTYFIDNH